LHLQAARPERIVECVLEQAPGDAAAPMCAPDDHRLDECRRAAVVGDVWHEEHGGGADRDAVLFSQVDGEIRSTGDPLPGAPLLVRRCRSRVAAAVVGCRAALGEHLEHGLEVSRGGRADLVFGASCHADDSRTVSGSPSTAR